MTALINNDTVNNLTYLNYFNNILNGEQNTLTAVTANRQPFRNAFQLRNGTGSIVDISAGDNRMNFFFNSTRENKTNKTATFAYYRVQAQHVLNAFAGSQNTTINSSTTTGTDIVSVTGTNITDNTTYTNGFEYAVIGNNSYVHAGFPVGNPGQLSTTTFRVITCGFLEDSPFTGNLINRSLYSVVFRSSSSSAFRVSSENTSTSQPILTTGIAQYPVTCASDAGDGTTPTSDLFATDLWIRDDPSGFAVGRIPNLLLCKSTSLSIGNLVKINPTIDGITNQKVWLVAANYGADKILMRVWTEGVQ